MAAKVKKALPKRYLTGKAPEKTIYVRHGVWRTDGGDIHVTIPGANTAVVEGVAGAHWSYRPGDRNYEVYDALLRREGR
jgi:hypothetical protein